MSLGGATTFSSAVNSNGSLLSLPVPESNPIHRRRPAKTLRRRSASDLLKELRLIPYLTSLPSSLLVIATSAAISSLDFLSLSVPPFFYATDDLSRPKPNPNKRRYQRYDTRTLPDLESPDLVLGKQPQQVLGSRLPSFGVTGASLCPPV